MGLFGLFFIVGALALGFLLGMRHATDPDHVVAVTTIVSKVFTSPWATAPVPASATSAPDGRSG